MAPAPNPPQDAIEQTFGSLIVGTWVQQLLLGYLLAQMVDYYRLHYSTDSRFNRSVVACLLSINVLLGATNFHVLYRSAVQYYGIFEFFDLQEWTMWTEPMWTAVGGFVAQVFFLMRTWRITHSIPMLVILTLLVLFSFGSGLAVSISFIIFKRFSTLGKFKIPITLWLVSTAVADLAIAAVLVYYLIRSKTMFKKTDKVINSLIQLTMETSALTAIIALLNLVLFLPLQDTAYHLLPQFSISRVYALTVMATLLSRTSLRAVLDSTTHASFATAIRGQQTSDGHIRVGVTTDTIGDLQQAHSKDCLPHDIELQSADGDGSPQSQWDSKRPGL